MWSKEHHAGRNNFDLVVSLNVLSETEKGLLVKACVPPEISLCHGILNVAFLQAGQLQLILKNQTCVPVSAMVIRWINKR